MYVHTHTHTHIQTHTHTNTHQAQNALLRQLINAKFPRDKIPCLHQSLPPRGFRPRLRPITPHAAPFRQQSLLQEGPEIWRDFCLFFFEGISGIRRRPRLCTEILRSQRPRFYYSKSPRVYNLFFKSHYRSYFLRIRVNLEPGSSSSFWLILASDLSMIICIRSAMLRSDSAPVALPASASSLACHKFSESAP